MHYCVTRIIREKEVMNLRRSNEGTLERDWRKIL